MIRRDFEDAIVKAAVVLRHFELQDDDKTCIERAKVTLDKATDQLLKFQVYHPEMNK